MNRSIDMVMYNTIDEEKPKTAKDLESISRWLHEMVEDVMSSYVEDSDNECFKEYTSQY